MKENNDLDKHFRGLKDLESGPPDGAKSSVEKHLIDAGMLKEKDESRGGLWLFALLALLLITPLVIMVTKKSKHVKLTAEQITAQKDSLNSLKNEVSNNTGALQQKQETADETRNRTAKKQAATNNELITNYRIEKGKRVKAKANSESAVYAEAHAANGLTGTAKEKKSRKKKEKNAVENNNNSGEFAAYLKEVPAVANDKKEDAKQEKASSEPGRTDKGALAENAKASTPLVDGAFAGQPNVPASADSVAENEKPAEKDTLLKKPAKDSVPKSKTPPVKEKSFTNVSFDFSGGPQFSSFRYGSGAIVDNETYINQSKQSEKTTPTFCAAFGIVLTMNHFIVETGIRHSLLSSDFSYSESYYTVDTSGSQPDTIRGVTHYLANNKISLIEFPILIGYNFHAANFVIEVKSGILVGYITSANTTILSLNSGEVVKYDALANSPYNKTCWSYLGAANILYPLGGRFSVFVQPSVKYGLNSLFKDNYAVTKTIQSTTVGIGLRVKL